MNSMKNILMKITGALIILVSIWLFYIGNGAKFEVLIMIFATIVMAVGGVIYISSSDKTYNDSVSSIRRMRCDRGKSVEDFYHAFKDQDSVLGAPWLGKIKWIKGNSLIFGPTENGDFLYLYKLFNHFYFCQCPSSTWIKGPESELWRIDREEEEIDFTSDEEMICYSLLAQSALPDIFEVLKIFHETDVVEPFPSEDNTGRIYQFDEEFSLTGKVFYLYDYDGNPIYEIEGTYPLKSFQLRDIDTNEEIFKMTKRLLHLNDHYDFYLYGNKYASFEQKINIMFDQFLMETDEGTFEVKSINDKVGVNYIVKLDEKTIGTIADRFNITAYNIVFDNFALHVREEKYLPLITAFAVMVAREQSRDRLN